MITKTIIKQNAYYDSVRLMNMSSKLTKFQGIHEAVVIMGTKMNKQILDNSGLLTKEGDKAKESDLIIVIQGEEQDLLDNVINQIDELIIEKTKSESNIQSEFRTIREAIVQRPQSNLILISCPGMYAATEAYKALMNGINVFLFSNNVKIEDEILLKKMALHRGLYLMGPDCGTSIINGHPLGFANSVNRGTVAVVASSGTGIQEVSSLIHRLGLGISQAIGVGSRDLHESVGGLMTKFALLNVSNDKNTEIIILISKSPSKKMIKKMLGTIEDISKSKPIIVLLLGDHNNYAINSSNVFIVNTLEESAIKAAQILSNDKTISQKIKPTIDDIKRIVNNEVGKKDYKQKWVKGLFSGGTFCAEAQVVLRPMLKNVSSNVPIPDNTFTASLEKSVSHTMMDMGSDEFTVGKPHPMIDFSNRVNTIHKNSRDIELSVLLIDIVLGFGAHENPAEIMIPELLKAKENIKKKGGSLSIVLSICGTNEDPQNRQSQLKKFKDAGMIVMNSNAQAAMLAGLIVNPKYMEILF